MFKPDNSTIYILFLLLPLFSTVKVLAAGEDYSVSDSTAVHEEMLPEYVKALDLYAEEDDKQAKKILKRIIKDMPETQWEYRARLLMAKIMSRSGDMKKALRQIDIILQDHTGLDCFDGGDIVRRLGDMGDRLALKKIRDILSNSKINAMRSEAARIIGKVAKKIEPERLRENADFLVEALDSEREMAVSREIARSIYRLGKLRADEIMRIYADANDYFKKKLLLLISMYDDEDMIMSLQQDAERSRSVLMNYVKWALAKMDPYRFARSFRGRLRKEKDAYMLYSGGSALELLGPSMERKYIDILEQLIGKVITIYGIQVDEGIIFTDIYQRTRNLH